MQVISAQRGLYQHTRASAAMRHSALLLLVVYVFTLQHGAHAQFPGMSDIGSWASQLSEQMRAFASNGPSLVSWELVHSGTAWHAPSHHARLRTGFDASDLGMEQIQSLYESMAWETKTQNGSQIFASVSSCIVHHRVVVPARVQESSMVGPL